MSLLSANMPSCRMRSTTDMTSLLLSPKMSARESIRDSASESWALAMCFWDINDLMMRTAFSVSSLSKSTDADMRSLASSMFFTVIPVAYT